MCIKLPTSMRCVGSGALMHQDERSSSRDKASCHCHSASGFASISAALRTGSTRVGRDGSSCMHVVCMSDQWRALTSRGWFQTDAPFRPSRPFRPLLFFLPLLSTSLRPCLLSPCPCQSVILPFTFSLPRRQSSLQPCCDMLLRQLLALVSG